MNRKPMLFIYEQLEPKPLSTNRFRIIETFLSLDGFRSRVTDQSFATFEEAKKFKDDYNGHD